MLHIIYNPIAGKGTAVKMKKQLDEALKRLNVKYQYYETKLAKDAIRIARELTAAEDEIDLIAMGGDGTLNEVLNGIRDLGKVRLGLIPCGSGNDFAGVAQIPRNINDLLELFLHGKAKYTDYIECGNVRGMNIAGTGVDVEILERRGAMKFLKGSLAYFAAFIRSLITFKPYTFTEENGCIHHAFIAAAGNGQCYGGGIPICPEARIDDGLLDIVIVDDLPKRKYLGALIKLLNRKLLDLPQTMFRRAASLSITSEKPMPIQIDGEIYHDKPFDVHVVHNVLRLYRP